MKAQNAINLGQISGEMKTWNNYIPRSFFGNYLAIHSFKAGCSPENHFLYLLTNQAQIFRQS